MADRTVPLTARLCRECGVKPCRRRQSTMCSQCEYQHYRDRQAKAPPARLCRLCNVRPCRPRNAICRACEYRRRRDRLAARVAQEFEATVKELQRRKDNKRFTVEQIRQRVERIEQYRQQAEQWQPIQFADRSKGWDEQE